jgi:heterodisulfide reductase subunit C
MEEYKEIYMPDDSNQSFYERVMAATPGGEKLITCLQCGTCGGSCPSGADMDATPRRLFAMAAANMEDEVLSSNTPWYCVSCYYCTVRCPQEIPITDLMYTFKRMAVARGKYHKDSHADFSKSFIGYVEQYGRSFEFGLATRYQLFHHPIGTVSKSMMGLDMLRKGRFNLTPAKIDNMPQLTAILKEAKRIAAQEEV